MKPRCDTCESAMKTPYERVGAKGSWHSIETWWYCAGCNRMAHHPKYLIAPETDDYLHTEAGEKFPTIARIRDELIADYVDMHELQEAIRDPPFLKL